MVTEMSRPIGAHDLTMQTGKLAKLADGAVVVTYGQTQVLATCVRSKPREGIDFFPLTIDVEERAYAAGKIPGSFFRREGRPGETAILTARLIDRPLRPTFKEGFRDEVQVVVHDLVRRHGEPVRHPRDERGRVRGRPRRAAVRRPGRRRAAGPDRRRSGSVNPTYLETEDATFDIVVAGSKSDDGGVDILMIEGEAPDATRGRCCPAARSRRPRRSSPRASRSRRPRSPRSSRSRRSSSPRAGVTRDGVRADAAVRRGHLGRRVVRTSPASSRPRSCPTSRRATRRSVR